MSDENTPTKPQAAPSSPEDTPAAEPSPPADGQPAYKPPAFDPQLWHWVEKRGAPPEEATAQQ